MHGKGKVTFAKQGNRSVVYMGEFKNGQFDGYGTNDSPFALMLCIQQVGSLIVICLRCLGGRACSDLRWPLQAWYAKHSLQISNVREQTFNLS